MFLRSAVLPMRYSGVSYRSIMAWSVSESIRPVASCVRVFVSRPVRYMNGLMYRILMIVLRMGRWVQGDLWV